MATTEALKTELSRDEQTEQTVSAIRMLNRLSVAEIRLKRLDQLSEASKNEMKAIKQNIHELIDSLLLGEDIRSSLFRIDQQVTQFELRLAL